MLRARYPSADFGRPVCADRSEIAISRHVPAALGAPSPSAKGPFGWAAIAGGAERDRETDSTTRPAFRGFLDSVEIEPMG